MLSIFRLMSLQLLGTTGFVALLMVFLLWMKQSFRFVAFIVLQRLSLVDFFWFVVWMLPDLFVMITPFAFFLSVLLLYSRYESGRLFIVLQGAGCSRRFLLRPVFYTGLLLALLLGFLALYIVPLAFQNFRKQELAMRTSFSEKAVQVGEFKKMGPFVLYAKEKHADGSFGGLLIFDERNTKEKVFLMGERAFLKPHTEGVDIVLKNGLRQTYDGERLSCFLFKDYTFFSRTEGRSKPRAQKLYEKSLGDLLRTKRSLSLRASSFFEAYQRIFTPLYVLVFGVLAGVVILYLERYSLFKRVAVAFVLFLALQLIVLLILQMNAILGLFSPLLVVLFLMSPFFVLAHEKSDMVAKQPGRRREKV